MDIYINRYIYKFIYLVATHMTTVCMYENVDLWEWELRTLSRKSHSTLRYFIQKRFPLTDVYVGARTAREHVKMFLLNIFMAGLSEIYYLSNLCICGIFIPFLILNALSVIVFQ